MAGIDKLGQKRFAIDLVADRPVEGNHLPAMERHAFEKVLRGETGGIGAVGLGDRLAASERLGAKLGLLLFEMGFAIDQAVHFLAKILVPPWPWDVSIPGTYSRRWAPCVRAHGPGQGQLP